MAKIPLTRTIPAGSALRVHTWIDADAFEPLYGIQANVRRGVWAHVVENDALLLFPSKAEAKAKIKSLRAKEAA